MRSIPPRPRPKMPFHRKKGPSDVSGIREAKEKRPRTKERYFRGDLRNQKAAIAAMLPPRKAAYEASSCTERSVSGTAPAISVPRPQMPKRMLKPFFLVAP